MSPARKIKKRKAEIGSKKERQEELEASGPRNDESFLLKYFFDAVEYGMGNRE